MAGMADIKRISETLGRLGPRKLLALALIGATIAAAVGAAGYVLSRPQFEILYNGLDKADGARIAAALRDNNITFDLSSDGATILVEYGQTSRARMLLADRGLPSSGAAGYEIFDKIGSLGLTSFMQEVTRLRALEGELARTIQAMAGVKAARVHLAMGEDATFRRSKQSASASVVVRLSSAQENAVAQAIRRLVASAVPGMTPDAVTVLNADGAILASGPDGEINGQGRAATLERGLSDALQDNVRRTLTPMVGLRNLNVSVAVRVNTDKKLTNETIYNPESRVERSVRVVRENQMAQNSGSQGTTGVERNVPSAGSKNSEGRQSNEENQKREELTNYEVSSKQIQVTSGAYAIERVSVAILVNKAGLLAAMGDQGDNKEALDKRLTEIGDLAASAAGLIRERGDVVKVSAVNFADDPVSLEPTPGPSFLQIGARHIGSVISAALVLTAVVAMGLLVVRPLAQSLIAHAPELPAPSSLQPMLDVPSLGAVAYSGATSGEAIEFAKSYGVDETPLQASQRRFDAALMGNEERAAAQIRDWMKNGAQS